MIVINKTYSIGKRFKLVRDGKTIEEYILAAVDYDKEKNKVKITLISLDDGQRWEDPILVDSGYNISIDDMNKLTGKGKFMEVS